MRIAFFHNLPPGGAKRVVYYQIKYLSQKHDVDLYTIKSQESDFLNFLKLKCGIYEYKFTLNSREGPIYKILNDFKIFWGLGSLHRKIASDIDNKKYDIVVVHPDRYTQAPFILSFLKTKKIYYCHELLRIAYEKHLMVPGFKTPVHAIYEKLTRSIRKNIDKRNALRSDVILTNSKFTKYNIEKYYKTSATVCYPGVDTEVFKKRSAKKTYDIAFIGDKVKEDGYDLFQDIIRLLPKKTKISVLSTREKGRWISDVELSRVYSRSKIVLSLAINEPFGLIPIEAMSCGVPVVALSEGGYRETVLDGKTGYLTSRLPNEISSKIQRLLGNSKLMKSFSHNSINYIKGSWDWDNKIKDLEKLIKAQIS